MFAECLRIMQLPYAEMLKRQERLAYFAQLATASKMTVQFRIAKTIRERDQGSLLIRVFEGRKVPSHT